MIGREYYFYYSSGPSSDNSGGISGSSVGLNFSKCYLNSRDASSLLVRISSAVMVSEPTRQRSWLFLDNMTFSKKLILYSVDHIPYSLWVLIKNGLFKLYEILYRNFSSDKNLSNK